MNHNPYDLKINDIVILDEKFNNSTKVIIESFTSNKMFAGVKDYEDDYFIWNVMTNRFTPIKPLGGNIL